MSHGALRSLDTEGIMKSDCTRLLLLLFMSCLNEAKVTTDPRVITYPGDINFALIIDGHRNGPKSQSNNSKQAGKLTLCVSSSFLIAGQSRT